MKQLHWTACICSDYKKPCDLIAFESNQKKEVGLGFFSLGQNIASYRRDTGQKRNSFFQEGHWAEKNGFFQEGHRMERPHHCPPSLYSLMLDCWDGEVFGRLNITEFVLRTLISNKFYQQECGRPDWAELVTRLQVLVRLIFYQFFFFNPDITNKSTSITCKVEF